MSAANTEREALRAIVRLIEEAPVTWHGVGVCQDESCPLCEAYRIARRALRRKREEAQP